MQSLDVAVLAGKQTPLEFRPILLSGSEKVMHWELVVFKQISPNAHSLALAVLSARHI